MKKKMRVMNDEKSINSDVVKDIKYAAFSNFEMKFEKDKINKLIREMKKNGYQYKGVRKVLGENGTIVNHVMQFIGYKKNEKDD